MMDVLAPITLIQEQINPTINKQNEKQNLQATYNGKRYAGFGVSLMFLGH